MTFLPIVGRELRVASRRRSTHWLRASAASLATVLGTWCFLMMRFDPAHIVALTLFGIMTGTAVLYCLFSGIRATADCLSEEKREGTFGLLFLTDLKGYDVVLGKLVANSLGVFYSVLAVVPMLAVPVLMGGVTWGEFVRMALLAINVLFFSLSLGMCTSAFCRSGRISMAVTFLVVLTVTGALPLCGVWEASVRSHRGVADGFLWPSAGFTFYWAFDTNYRVKPSEFWGSWGLIHAFGWSFLAGAALIAPRTWQDKPAGVARLRWRERWKLWSYGDPAKRTEFRRQLLDSNALYWLYARERLKPTMAWIVLALLGCGWVWGYLKFGREWLNTFIYFTTAVVMNMLLKGWVAAESGRQLAYDRLQGSLELLLVTPLTVRDILRGQMLALARQLLGPLIVVLIIEFLLMLASISEASPSGDAGFIACVWLSGMAMLLMDVVALYWVGMWLALVVRNPNRVAGGAMVRILALPWVAYGAVMLAVSLLNVSRNWEPSGLFFLGVWFGLGLVVNVVFGRMAREKLLTQFRIAAAARYAPKTSLWKRMFGLGHGQADRHAERSRGSSAPGTAPSY